MQLTAEQKTLYLFIFSELYAKQTNQPPAKHLLEPDCECARNYFDSFNLLSASKKLDGVIRSSTCHTGFTNDFTTNRYSDVYKGKWAIFTPDGWISDITNEAEIVITFSQLMLVSSCV